MAYITVRSCDFPTKYPDNKPYDFTVDLLDRIDNKNDDWYIGLSYCSYADKHDRKDVYLMLTGVQDTQIAGTLKPVMRNISSNSHYPNIIYSKVVVDFLYRLKFEVYYLLNDTLTKAIDITDDVTISIFISQH